MWIQAFIFAVQRHLRFNIGGAIPRKLFVFVLCLQVFVLVLCFVVTNPFGFYFSSNMSIVALFVFCFCFFQWIYENFVPSTPVSHIHLIAHAILNLRSSLCWCLSFRCNFWFNRKSNRKFLVQTEPGTETKPSRDFEHFRFGLGLIPGLDRKFLVQTGFWTDSKPKMVKILSGRFFLSFSVWVRSDSRFRPEISGSNRILDRVQTKPAQNRLWRVFGWFRFHSGPGPGLDRKFSVWFPVGPEIESKILAFI
jgi:hypothetical protein